MNVGVFRELRKHWFVTALCAGTSAFFIVALMYSTAMFVSVVDAGQNITLSDADESASLLLNGSLVISFSVLFKNPSKHDVMVSSVSWGVKLDISGFSGSEYLPLGSEYSAYVGPDETAVVTAGSSVAYEFEVVVSDPTKLSVIQEYIDYQASLGESHTFETVEYIHDFRIMGWLGDFKHDYEYYGELYLNDLVRVQKHYLGGRYS